MELSVGVQPGKPGEEPSVNLWFMWFVECLDRPEERRRAPSGPSGPEPAASYLPPSLPVSLRRFVFSLYHYENSLLTIFSPYCSLSSSSLLSLILFSHPPHVLLEEQKLSFSPSFSPAPLRPGVIGAPLGLSPLGERLGPAGAELVSGRGFQTGCFHVVFLVASLSPPVTGQGSGSLPS